MLYLKWKTTTKGYKTTAVLEKAGESMLMKCSTRTSGSGRGREREIQEVFDIIDKLKNDKSPGVNGENIKYSAEEYILKNIRAYFS